MNQFARWCLKKSARQGIAALSAASDGVRSIVAPAQGPRIRVFTYHRFGNLRRDPFCVDEATFAAQMEWLARHELAVSLADVHAFLGGTGNLPADAVLVTIDDGAPSVHARALSILQRFGIPAVLFVPAGELRDGPEAGSDDEGPDGRMSRAQLIEISRAGVTIGSHAWTHRSLGRLSVEEARDELVRSRTTLEQLIERPVTAFAYPFGTRADFNASTRSLLESAGYTCGFTSQHGAIVPDSDPLTLPRIKVEGGEGLWMFRRLAHGGLDGWRWIDRTLWPLQAARG